MVVDANPHHDHAGAAPDVQIPTTTYMHGHRTYADIRGTGTLVPYARLRTATGAWPKGLVGSGVRDSMVGRNNFTGYGLGVRRVLGAVRSRVQSDDIRLYICRDRFTDRLTICRPDRQGHAIALS
jgi:hypothetical protein